MRERELHNCFYTGSLNHKATSSLPGQPELGFHYIQKFYKRLKRVWVESFILREKTVGIAQRNV